VFQTEDIRTKIRNQNKNGKIKERRTDWSD